MAEVKQLPWGRPAHPGPVGPQAMQVSTAEPRKREDLGATLSPAKKSRDSTANVCVERTDGDEGAAQRQEKMHVGPLLRAPGPHFTVPPPHPPPASPTRGGQFQQPHLLSPITCKRSVLASGKI